MHTAQPEKALIIVYSYHHNNTEKIARAFAPVLNARVVTPREITAAELQEYTLIGFGSGIYGGKHHASLLALADAVPQGNGKKVFVFSTFGAPAALLDQKEFDKLVAGNHAVLKRTLQSKGYQVVAEFSCPGFNTNSFLKFFGGLNKGRPNTEDIKRAEAFAHNLQ